MNYIWFHHHHYNINNNNNNYDNNWIIRDEPGSFRNRIRRGGWRSRRRAVRRRAPTRRWPVLRSSGRHLAPVSSARTPAAPPQRSLSNRQIKSNTLNYYISSEIITLKLLRWNDTEMTLKWHQNDGKLSKENEWKNMKWHQNDTKMTGNCRKIMNEKYEMTWKRH